MSTHKPHPANLIAEYFLHKGNEDKKEITNKKLQKLLYYAQAWHLVFYDKKLFKEHIEAWIHGPAIKNIYKKYKKFGFSKISVPYKPLTNFNKLNHQQKKLLNEIWDIYGKYDANYLEQLSHNERPWQKAREGLEPTIASSNIISENEMKSFYKELLQKHTS